MTPDRGGDYIDGFWRDTIPECPTCLNQSDPSPTQTLSQFGVTAFRRNRFSAGFDRVNVGDKVTANIGIGINNFSNAYLNGNDPANVIAPFESSSKVQDVAMHALEVLTVVSPLLAEMGPVTTLSASSRQTTVVAAETANTVERVSNLKPGPFATESIPARGPQRNFTVSERNQINEIGLKSGCQTCGTTNPGTRVETLFLTISRPTP